MYLDENIIRSNRIEAAVENMEQTFQKSPAEPSPRNLFDIEIGFQYNSLLRCIITIAYTLA